MKTVETSNVLLFRAHDTKIYTNPPDSPLNLRHKNSLSFSLINASKSPIEFKGSSNALITFSFKLGESSQAMFPTNTMGDDFGVISGPAEFSDSTAIVSKLNKSKVKLQISMTKDTSVFCLNPGQSLSFTWKNFSTSSPEGFTTFSLSFSNVQELAGLTITSTLYKETIYANVPCFYVSPSGAVPGSEVTLYWKMENAESGYILPLGEDISSNKSSSLSVPLKENTHYYLYADSKYRSVYREAFAQWIPPYISDFSVDGLRELKWEVHFVSEVRLRTEDDYKPVDFTGSITLNAGISTVSLQCAGLYALERHIAIPPCPEIESFCLDVWTFPNHECAILTWRTQNLKSLKLIVNDNAAYELPALESGSYEQVYEKDMPVYYELTYNNSGTIKLASSNYIWRE